MDTATTQLIADELRDPCCGFSIGCLGALAEFQEPDACAPAATGNGALAASSDRGAIRIESAVSASAVAYEALSAAKDAWQCGIVLVTAPDASSGRAREVLTELPPDADAPGETPSSLPGDEESLPEKGAMLVAGEAAPATEAAPSSGGTSAGGWLGVILAAMLFALALRLLGFETIELKQGSRADLVLFHHDGPGSPLDIIATIFQGELRHVQHRQRFTLGCPVNFLEIANLQQRHGRDISAPTKRCRWRFGVDAITLVAMMRAPFFFYQTTEYLWLSKLQLMVSGG